jgi:hypothetical protein
MYDKQGIFFNKTNYHHSFEPIITNHGYVNVLDKKTIAFNFKDNKINDVGGGPL